MGEVLGCVHEGVMVREHGTGTEDTGVTTLLTVEAMKFKTLVIWMSQGSSSTGGVTIMETIGVEVFGGLTCIAPTWNIGPESPGLAGMVMVGGMTHREWGQSFMLVANEAGVGIRTGSIGSVEGGGCHFGVAPNVE